MMNEEQNKDSNSNLSASGSRSKTIALNSIILYIENESNNLVFFPFFFMRCNKSRNNKNKKQNNIAHLLITSIILNMENKRMFHSNARH